MVSEYGKILQQMRSDHEMFHRRGEDAWKQYVPRHDNASSPYKAKRFNLFWSNVNTIRPNLYFQRPELRVKRRILESQPLSILASEIAQRTGTFNLEEQNDFNSVMSRVVTDHLVPGRGQVWLYYMPVEGKQRYEVFPAPDGSLVTSQGLPIQSDRDVKTDSYTGQLYVEEELLQSEKMCIEHVHWSDFLHSTARDWQEVTVVARAVYLTQSKAKERFGKKAQDLTYTYGYDKNDKDKLRNIEGSSDELSRACVWELWDKENEVVVYLSERGEQELKTEDPPVAFRNFFPCPEPLLATVSEDSLLPYSDYYFYQKQAQNLNQLTDKIDSLTQAINWAGCYNGQFGTMLKQVLEGQEGVFIPAKEWSTFSQQGGFDGNVAYLPLQMLQQTLIALYQARDVEKGEAYEISGIADILRGASDPNETATAQRTKASFASLRLAERQQEIQRFVRDTYAIMVEGCVERFNPRTIGNMSGALVQDPNYLQAIQLLKNDQLRTFAIDIETDATLRANEEQEKQSAVEFMGAFSQAMQMFNATKETNPEAIGIAAEMLKFTIRRYSAGRNMETDIEATIDQSVQQMMQSMQQPPQPPQPTPKEQIDMQKIQLEGQKAQQQAMKDQAEEQRKQAELGIKAQEAETKRQKVIGDLTLEAQKLESETQKAAAEAYRQRQKDAAEAATRYGAR